MSRSSADLGHSRNDDSAHHGDPQVMNFPDVYGPRPPWHDIQAEVRGPAAHDLEHTFRERWYGSSVLDLPSPVRQLYDRAYHIGAMTSRPLPEPTAHDETRRGTHAVQVLRTYPARLRRYPFAPHGERSIAHAYRKVFARAQCLVYLEDQYLWSRPVARIIASALRDKPGLHVIAVVPRYPDSDGPITRMPGVLGQHEVIRACAGAGGERFAVYDLENHQGTPVYVHAKVVVVDDVWAMIGSDNLNRRSWSHDSELSIGVLDSKLDAREPRDPAGLGDGARTFARDLRLRLWREHLDRRADDVDDLLHPQEAFAAFRHQARQLAAWHKAGSSGWRPPDRCCRIIAPLLQLCSGYGQLRFTGWSSTQTGGPGGTASAAGSDAGRIRASGRPARRLADRCRSVRITAILPANQARPQSQPPTTSVGQCTPSQTRDQPTAAA
jgi:phosphatidylserine/phosphatidylglycerophosphate/cardiolipin synthase-like enzyme